MKRQTRITKRPWHPMEMEILMHIARYGITTANALLTLKLKAIKRMKHAQDRLSALARRGDLIRHTRLTDEDCYSFSEDALKKMNEMEGEPPTKLRSTESLMRAYALLAACCLQHGNRKLLTRNELALHFPDLHRFHQQNSYYLASDAEQFRLGFVRIDSGGRGRWDRIARKACEDMCKHLNVPALQPLIEKHQFEICVVTALPCKANRINELLKSKYELFGVPYRVISIPALINFIRPHPE